MTKEQITELINALKTNPQLKESLQDRELTPELLTEIVCEKAKERGFHLTAEEFNAYMVEEELERKKKTEKTTEQIAMLSDQDVDQVGGGFECAQGVHSLCKDTFKDGENCWSNDGCDKNNNIYPYYRCQHNYNYEKCGAFDSLKCSEVLL